MKLRFTIKVDAVIVTEMYVRASTNYNVDFGLYIN